MATATRASLFALAVAVVGVALAADVDPEHLAAAKLKNPQPADAASIAAGKAAYEKGCFACHGADGKGAATIGYLKPAPDLTDDTWAYGGSDGEIFDSIKNGVPPAYNMEGWGERLDDTTIWNLVNYVRSLKKGA